MLDDDGDGSIKKILEEASVGAGLESLVDVTVFLTNMSDYAEFNKVRLILSFLYTWCATICRCTISILILKLALPALLLLFKVCRERIC